MGPTPDPSTAMATPDPPAYSVVALAQEIDFATAIQTLTNNVFDLKSKWEQAIVALNSLPGANSNILSTPFETYLQFIKAAQDSAIEARASVLQYFIEIVVGSAQDPDCPLKDKLAEADEFLKTLKEVGPPKWTPEQTEGLSHSVQEAVWRLKSHAKELDLKLKINDDTELSTARKEVNDVIKKQAELQDHIHHALEEKAREHPGLDEALNTIRFALEFTPIWIRDILLLLLGHEDPVLSHVGQLIEQDEALSMVIVKKQHTVKRLETAHTKTKDDRQKANALQEILQSLDANFKSISLKLGQICVITKAIEPTVRSWSEFLRSSDAKNKFQLQSRVDHLAAVGRMYEPIALALGGFVSRQS